MPRAWTLRSRLRRAPSKSGRHQTKGTFTSGPREPVGLRTSLRRPLPPTSAASRSSGNPPALADRAPVVQDALAVPAQFHQRQQLTVEGGAPVTVRRAGRPASGTGAPPHQTVEHGGWFWGPYLLCSPYPAPAQPGTMA